MKNGDSLHRVGTECACGTEMLQKVCKGQDTYAVVKGPV
jgi:hypothetical protein